MSDLGEVPVGAVGVGWIMERKPAAENKQGRKWKEFFYIREWRAQKSLHRRIPAGSLPAARLF
jgi:hypothetical protein